MAVVENHLELAGFVQVVGQESNASLGGSKYSQGEPLLVLAEELSRFAHLPLLHTVRKIVQLWNSYSDTLWFTVSDSGPWHLGWTIRRKHFRHGRRSEGALQFIFLVRSRM